jgi:hypothetical protein
MILRRLSTAVRKQDWFTVIVETLIVVFGVFIGLQVNNWNAARQDRITERVIEVRLLKEFNAHQAQLSDLKNRLAVFREASRQVLVAIKGDTQPTDRDQFADWLFDATNLGRPPARSATYIQLISSGEFNVLQDETLKTLLIQFDQEIERTSFLYETGADLLFSSADLVAATSSNFDDVKDAPSQFSRITDFDFERLKESEGEIEWIFYLHSNNYIAANRLEEIVVDIIAVLDSRQ